MDDAMMRELEELGERSRQRDEERRQAWLAGAPLWLSPATGGFGGYPMATAFLSDPREKDPSYGIEAGPVAVTETGETTPDGRHRVCRREDGLLLVINGPYA